MHKKLPLSKSVPLLKTIEAYALHMGTGSREVHLFVDPLCPHSRDLMEMISENKKALSRNSYSIYLYTLKRLHSEETVTAIYNSDNPFESMLAVMVEHKKPDLKQLSKGNVSAKVDAIAKVAQELDVYKRPYLIFIKKPKKERGQ